MTTGAHRGRAAAPRRRCGLLGVVLILGCHGAHPRESFPPYYRGWDGVDPALATQIEESRGQANRKGRRPEQLLAYGRLSARLARRQAEEWIRLADASTTPSPAHVTRLTRARQRVLESCAHTLPILEEYRLLEGSLPWQERIDAAWLFVLQGSDAEAERALLLALQDPATPEPTRSEIRAILDQLVVSPQGRVP